MKKILLIIVSITLFHSLCFGSDIPNYNDGGYPVRFATLDKVKELNQRLSELDSDVSGANLAGLVEYYSHEMFYRINTITKLLVLENIHSIYGQFCIPALQAIRPYVLMEIGFFKRIPDECNKAMGQSGTSPAEGVYFRKIMDVSRETLSLLQELAQELEDVILAKQKIK